MATAPSPTSQTKLVSVPRGRIKDVLVDLRPSSDSYREWDSVELSATMYNSVFVPRGFAHGYLTLEDDTVVNYHLDNYYSPENEGGIRWDDPELAIDWDCDAPLLSNRDRNLPFLSEIENPFVA